MTMKFLSTALLVILLHTTVNAQLCDYSIGANITVIQNDTTLSGFGNYWVCEGLEVAFMGTAFAWMEANCTVLVAGNMGNYSMKSNGTIIVSGINNVVVYDESTTLIDNTGTVFPTLCTEVVYGYTNAPAGGCDVLTGLDGAAQRDAITISPNPATDRLNIQNLKSGNVRVALIDISGRTVFATTTIDGALMIDQVPPGVYMVAIEEGANCSMRRLVVE